MTTKYAQRLKASLEESIQAQQLFLQQEHELASFDAAVVQTYRSGGRLYIAGNGGSAADAQHLAAEFVCRLSRDRASLPAEALTVDSSTLTAIGNDYGFADIFLGIYTSGNSENIRPCTLCRS